MPTDSNDGSDTLNELLAELEKETLPEESSSDKSEKIKDKQASKTIKDLKNTDTDTYEYSEDRDLSDNDW